MNKTAWIIFSLVTVTILGSLVVVSTNNRLDVSKIDTNVIQLASSQDGNIGDHIFGKVDSPVTLIEYGDFQCPGCGAIYPTVKEVTDKYKDQVQFVFRNFPITTAHANAKAAAGAAEAAGLQGKYWEMHDNIYAAQSAWSDLTGTNRSDFFTNFAKQLGLDVDKFNSDIASTAVTSKINYDYALGKKAGVEGTPTFFLDGTKLDSNTWGDKTKFEAALDAELTKAGIALPASN